MIRWMLVSAGEVESRCLATTCYYMHAGCGFFYWVNTFIPSSSHLEAGLLYNFLHVCTIDCQESEK